MGTQKDHRQGTGSVESLRDEFREHLHIFYSTLKLAAPTTRTRTPSEP